MSDSVPPSADDERLLAYLDGELSSEDRACVERQLAEDPASRQRLNDWQRIWQSLDTLNPSLAAHSFTATTLELAALKEYESPQGGERNWRRLIIGRWSVAASLLISLFAGFGIVRALIDRPRQRLLRDWTIIERIDRYQHVPDIGFLRTLNERELFPEESPDET